MLKFGMHICMYFDISGGPKSKFLQFWPFFKFSRAILKSRLDDHWSDLPLKYDHLATPPWILKEDDEDDYFEEIPEQD